VKTYIKEINMNNEFALQQLMIVSVVFHDDEEDPHKNAVVSVYVDKSVTDIAVIEKMAIEKAMLFLSRIVMV
jgi:hypothetical protein